MNEETDCTIAMKYDMDVTTFAKARLPCAPPLLFEVSKFDNIPPLDATQLTI
jgi:hypothetical protein